MVGVALLSRARSAGLRIETRGDRLIVAGPKRYADLAQSILAHKSEVLAVLQANADRVVGSVRKVLPEAHNEEVRDHEAPLEGDDGPIRLVIERNRPKEGLVRLNDWTDIRNPARCIEIDLGSLQTAVFHRNMGVRSAFTDLVDEYLERLRACGCEVRVERVS